MQGDIQFNDNIPLYEQKMLELRAFLEQLAKDTDVYIAQIQIELDSIHDYQSIMAELSEKRKWVEDVSQAKLQDGTLLRDFLPEYSIEQLVDYILRKIKRLEGRLEELDELVDRECSKMSFRLYVTDREESLSLINLVLNKINSLGGKITRREYANFLPNVLHNPYFIDVEFSEFDNN